MFRTETVRALIWTSSTSRADEFHLARVMSGEVRPRPIPTIASHTDERASAPIPHSVNPLNIVRSQTISAADTPVPAPIDEVSLSVVTRRTKVQYPAVGTQSSRVVRCECDDQVHIPGSRRVTSHDVGGRLEHGQL